VADFVTSGVELSGFSKIYLDIMELYYGDGCIARFGPVDFRMSLFPENFIVILRS